MFFCCAAPELSRCVISILPGTKLDAYSELFVFVSFHLVFLLFQAVQMKQHRFAAFASRSLCPCGASCQCAHSQGSTATVVTAAPALVNEQRPFAWTLPSRAGAGRPMVQAARSLSKRSSQRRTSTATPEPEKATSALQPVLATTATAAATAAIVDEPAASVSLSPVAERSPSSPPDSPKAQLPNACKPPIAFTGDQPTPPAAPASSGLRVLFVCQSLSVFLSSAC